MWIQAANIKCKHGFSNRHGGVSQLPYSTLNFGGTGDTLENIQENKRLALEQLNISNFEICNLNQVHGNTVCLAKPGSQTGDALVSNQAQQILAISIADCYPILFYDELNQVIGSAHAGWRGTVSKIAEKTLIEMEKLGAHLPNIQVAIGQGICQNHFEVGKEVLQQFEQAGFNNNCWENNKIDLLKCNLEVLINAGVDEKNIWSMNLCTYENDFFSYRRDQGQTGRMWAVIAMGKQFE